MAVIIRDKKSFSGLGGIIGWFVVVIIIIGAAYYIFFKRPEQIEILIPQNVQTIEHIINIQRDPERIINSPEFQARRVHVQPLQVLPESFGVEYPLAPFRELIEFERALRASR